MKRIEFIAPVEAMRGNISGAQQLTYGNGFRAFDVHMGDAIAPDAYEKRYIGFKRTRNGKKYFALKTRTTVNLSETNRLGMSAFGGACSLAKAASRDLNIVTNLQLIYRSEVEKGLVEPTVLFRNWIQTKVYPMLKEKENSVIISDGEHTVTINNPWISGGSGTDVSVPDSIKAKFNAYLS